VVTRADGEAMRFPTRKSEALFAYLLERQGEDVSREVLAELLWPYSAPEQSRASLRQEVSVLRKTLGPEHETHIASQADKIGFNAEHAQIDLWRFRKISQDNAAPKHLTDALELYAGPFLEGFRIRSQPWSDWVTKTRNAEEASALRMGSRALDHWTAKGHDANVIKTAQHLCRIDRTHQPAHRALVQTYINQGNDPLAKRQMAQCIEDLKSHSNAKPAAETLALFQAFDEGSQRPKGSAARTAPRTSTAKQRRHVAVLSVWTNSHTDDPEDFEEEITGFAQRAAQVISRHGGSQIFHQSGRVLACFGYPSMDQKTADRAVYAAFDMLKAVNGDAGAAFQCQIGISHGLALVFGDADQLSVSGAVVGNAERLAHAASQNSVFVDAAMAGTLSKHIVLTEAQDGSGAKQVAPIQSWTPATAIKAHERYTREMVGRDAQFAQALDLLEQAKSGKGNAAAIIGDAGAGKSRLISEIYKTARARDFDIKLFQGNPHLQKSALAPVIDQMFRDGMIDRTAGASLRQTITNSLTALSPELAQAAHYFELLSGAAEGDREAVSHPVSKQEKHAALRYFATQAQIATPDRPALLIFEDAHWFDPTTCEAISCLINAISGTSSCSLFVVRTGQAPEVLNRDQVRHIELPPLDPNSAKTLLRNQSPGTPISGAALANIIERSEGNPLVIEEFAKALETRGTISVSLSKLGVDEEFVAAPDRILPLLLSRIDKVPGAIKTLQNASVFGHQFSLDQLAQVLATGAVPKPLLEDLERAGIIRTSEHEARASYTFKHALISEAIYSTIPLRDLPVLHIAAARALLSDENRAHDAEVARHFRVASAFDDAAHYFERSGDKAVRVAAHSEAISEYTAALKVLGRSANPQGQAQKELSLNRKIAAQIIGLRGIPTAEAIPYYKAAQDLSHALCNHEEVVNAGWGLWSIHLMAAELDECLKVANALRLGLGNDASKTARLIVTYMLGVTHAYRGTLPEATFHLEGVAELYYEGMNEELYSRFGMHIGLTSDSFLAWVYALKGDEQLADAATASALSKARQDNNGLNTVFAHVFAATKCLFLGQVEAAGNHAQIALKGAEEMQFKQWIAQAKMQLARIADLRGDAGALAALQRGLADYLATDNMVLARPYAQVWIAEAMIRQNRFGDALDVLDDLQTFTEKSKEQYLEVWAKEVRTLALEMLARDR
jgi:DNA-binding SARP family transcriptional activator